MGRVGECKRCGEPMSFTQLRRCAQPATRLHAAHGLCQSCYGVRFHVPGWRGRRGSHKEQADPVVVERICGGDRDVPANLAERRQVVRWLTERGYGINEIARMTGMSSRTAEPSHALIMRTLKGTHRTGHRAAIWMRTRTAAS